MVQFDPPAFQSPYSKISAVLPSHGRIHQAREDPLGLILIVGRQVKFLVFQSRIFAKWLLECVERADC